MKRLLLSVLLASGVLHGQTSSTFDAIVRHGTVIDGSGLACQTDPASGYSFLA